MENLKLTNQVKIVNGARLKVLSQRSRERQGHLVTTFFSILLEALARAIKQGKNNNKRHPDSKERIETVILDNMILYVENSDEPTIELLELISNSSKIAGYMINIQKLIVFLYISNEQAKNEIEKLFYLQ